MLALFLSAAFSIFLQKVSSQMSPIIAVSSISTTLVTSPHRIALNFTKASHISETIDKYWIGFCMTNEPETKHFDI